MRGKITENTTKTHAIVVKQTGLSLYTVQKNVFLW